MKTFSLFFFIPIALATSLLCAQSSTSTLIGFVRDESGNALPGTMVSARNVGTELERSDSTTEEGSYRIPSLPVGTYEVTAEIQGFATEVQKDIKMDVGRTVSLDFVLRLSTSGETVEVRGQSSLIERTESHSTTIVNPKQIANLPLNDRQFANLAILAPGTSLVENPDPSRFRSFAIGLMGSAGRSMNITIDSGDNNEDTIGGINQFYPLESIAEYNFLTHNYKAEYGRASSGVLNVVTKSGTNNLHGSVFSLFRDEAFNALSKAERNEGIQDPSPFSREQFGGSFGGPIQKDTAHFFVSFEREQLDIPIIVDTLGVVPEQDGAYNQPYRHSLSVGKLTSSLNPEQYLVVRYGHQKSTGLYDASPPTYAPTTWATIENTLHSILASHNYLIGDDELNELLFQYADFKNQITPSSNDPLEIFLYSPVYLVGQNPNSPAIGQQKKYQLKDDFSWTSTLWKGIHNFKTGMNFVHEPRVGGVIDYNEKPFTYVYAGDSRDSPIIEIEQLRGLFEYDFPNNQYGIFFQDDWNVNERLTFNLGVRYDYVTGFELDQSQNQLYQELVQAPFDYSWLDPVKANPSGKVSNDTNNIAPRLGIAYDWKGDGTTVLRGSWGLYYDFPYTNSNLLWPNAALSNWGYSYHYVADDGILNADGSLFRVGDPLPPNQINGFEDVPPREVASPDFVVPYTRQFSVGFSYLIHKNSAVDVDYINAAGRDRYVRFRYLTAENQNPFQSSRFHYNGAFHDYNALNISFRNQSSQTFQFQAAYTFSKVTGNTLVASDDFRLRQNAFFCADCSLDYRIGPKDDPKMEGPLDTDVRHRLVASAIVDLPARFQLSGIFTANSAPPFNAFINDGDDFPYSIVDSHVNSRRGSSFSQFDLRISKYFSIGNGFEAEAIFEVFNLFNADNPGGYIGNAEDELFGEPTRYGEPRGAQLGARITF